MPPVKALSSLRVPVYPVRYRLAYIFVVLPGVLFQPLCSIFSPLSEKDATKFYRLLFHIRYGYSHQSFGSSNLDDYLLMVLVRPVFKILPRRIRPFLKHRLASRESFHRFPPSHLLMSLTFFDLPRYILTLILIQNTVATGLYP